MQKLRLGIFIFIFLLNLNWINHHPQEVELKWQEEEFTELIHSSGGGILPPWSWNLKSFLSNPNCNSTFLVLPRFKFRNWIGNQFWTALIIYTNVLYNLFNMPPCIRLHVLCVGRVLFSTMKNSVLDTPYFELCQQLLTPYYQVYRQISYSEQGTSTRSQGKALRRSSIAS